MFMSSAVLVTLRFKQIASIRVIGKPYALQNGASVRWAAACRLHAPQVGLEMTLEGVESHIWCSKIGWQTVPCSWSIDGEALPSLM